MPAWPKRSAGLAGFPFREERPRDQLRRLYRASGEGGAADREGPFPCCVGASERSACPPLMRRAKGDAASIRCSIPLSCKAAVVCAGLTAAGGKGGARPRRGGDKGGPESPTNRPAWRAGATAARPGRWGGQPQPSRPPWPATQYLRRCRIRAYGHQTAKFFRPRTVPRILSGALRRLGDHLSIAAHSALRPKAWTGYP